jgi:hypothetical protein
MLSPVAGFAIISPLKNKGALAMQENANEIHSKFLFLKDFPSTLYRANYTQLKGKRVDQILVESDVVEIALPCTDAYLDVRAARTFGRKIE